MFKIFNQQNQTKHQTKDHKLGTYEINKTSTKL